MGTNDYSDAFYKARVDARKASGAPTFIHDAYIRSGKVSAGVHASLNIRGKIRESRDSKNHPNSTPIGIVFDQTASMDEVPGIMQDKLPQFMGLLLRKTYIEDPQVLFGAIGDYNNHEDAPLQIGQFESGIEMDDNITHIYLEAKGGGSSQESYQNALYFFAHRTRCDAFEKRGKKGYLFIIGDEMAYLRSTKAELDALIGDGAQGDASLDEIMAAVKEKWEVFFLLPKGTQHWSDPKIENFWKKYLGQNFIRLEDPSAVCEVIGALVGICEGTATSDSLAADLKDVGAHDAIVRVTTASVDAIAKERALTRVGTGGSLPAKKGHSDKIERL